jgi:hypothetical protein
MTSPCTHLDHVHVTQLPEEVDGVIRSLERGEDWSWCYVDEVAMLIPEVKGSTRIPRHRSAAGQ